MDLLKQAQFSCRPFFLTSLSGSFVLFIVFWAGFQLEFIPYLFDLQEASPEWTPSLCRLPPDGRPPVLACCGHRGAPRLAPENTLPAFQRAFKVGANCIELDAHLTRDKHLAVVHGETLTQHLLPKNYSGIPPRVEDLSWSQIRELDAGIWFGISFARVRVPALEEVVTEFWGRQVQIVVELKVDPCVSSDMSGIGVGESDSPALGSSGSADSSKEPSTCPADGVWEQTYAETLLQWIHEFPVDEKRRPPLLSLVFTSFNLLLIDNLLKAWRPMELEERKGPLEGRVQGFAYIYGPQADNSSISGTPGSDWIAVHDSLVPHVKRRSGHIISWVTDGLPEQLKQVKMGVQAVTTNDPTTCPALCNSARREGG